MSLLVATPRNLVSRQNRQRLGTILDDARRCGGAPPDLLMFLEEKLELADCLPADEMPDNVVTMNSCVRLRDVSTNDLRTVVLRYPDAVGPSCQDVSVLEPLGGALLGCRVGDEILVKGPHRRQRLRLIEVCY